MMYPKKNMNSLCVLLTVAFLGLTLGGCGTQTNSGTPVVEKHAKRGYNKPYQIKGVWYHPQKHYEYSETAVASYYGGTDVFHGRKTSNGETFDMNRLSAAHKTLPLPCVVRVTNLENGRSIKLKVNDRGPFIDGRIIDVSRKAAKMLGFYDKGTAKVRVESLVDDSIAVAGGHKSCDINAEVIHTAERSEPAQKKSKVLKKEKRPLGYQTKPQGPLAKIQKAIPGPRFIRVSEHSSSAEARSTAKALAQTLMVQTKFEGNGRTYRVVLGPIPPSVNLKNLLHKIKSQGYQNAITLTN